MLGEEGIVKNYLREVDWIQGSMYSATEIYSIVDKWNALHNCCMDSTTLNKIKSKFTYSWNLKHKVMCVMICDNRLRQTPVSNYAINVFSIDGLGEFSATNREKPDKNVHHYYYHDCYKEVSFPECCFSCCL